MWKSLGVEQSGTNLGMRNDGSAPEATSTCRIKDLFFSWSREPYGALQLRHSTVWMAPMACAHERECRSGVVNRVWFHLEFMVLNQLKKFEASSGLMDFIVSWGRPLPSSPIHQERETLLLDTFRIFLGPLASRLCSMRWRPMLEVETWGCTAKQSEISCLWPPMTCNDRRIH